MFLKSIHSGRFLAFQVTSATNLMGEYAIPIGIPLSTSRWHAQRACLRISWVVHTEPLNAFPITKSWFRSSFLFFSLRLRHILPVHIFCTRWSQMLVDVSCLVCLFSACPLLMVFFRHIAFSCRIFVNHLLFVKQLVVLQNSYFPGLVSFCVFITWLFLLVVYNLCCLADLRNPICTHFLVDSGLAHQLKLNFVFFVFLDLEVIHLSLLFYPLAGIDSRFIPLYEYAQPFCSPLCFDYSNGNTWNMTSFSLFSSVLVERTLLWPPIEHRKNSSLRSLARALYYEPVWYLNSSCIY